MKTNHMIGVIIIVIAVALIAFWAGTTYAARTSASSSAGRTGQTVLYGSGMRGRGGFGGGIFGTIVAKDASSITVELGGRDATSTNGTNTGSRIVLLSDATQIAKVVAGTQSDLSVGEAVMVQGTPNSDGSVTATQIQIRPAGQAQTH